ncbi:MAG: hypothetical protein J1E00_07005, partial [Oscillospiraceae bacterium]|nr:hypothetical protein [Oscillospiraceae bacterium]
MFILVVNAGSSSLKYQLFDMDRSEMIAKGLCERIGTDGLFSHQVPAKGVEIKKIEAPMPTHSDAV